MIRQSKALALFFVIQGFLICQKNISWELKLVQEFKHSATNEALKWATGHAYIVQSKKIVFDYLQSPLLWANYLCASTCSE